MVNNKTCVMKLAAPILAALLVGCAASRSVATPRDADAARQFGRITAELSAPRMEGRGPGTKGLDLARDYLVAEYRKAGLQPVFGDSYIQRFEIDNGVQAIKQSLAVDGQSLESGVDFTPMGFSASASFAGETVFVGYSIVNRDRRHDSFANLPQGALRGRVAIALRYEPQNEKGVSRWTKKAGAWTRAAAIVQKARQAFKRGATALLLINPPSQKTPLKTLRQTMTPTAAPIPVMHITAETFAKISDGADLAALQRAADRGKHPFGVYKTSRVTGEVELKRARAPVYNVAGLLPGAGSLQDEIVVIGAHYDHLGYGDFGSMTGSHDIHPGADDNASGAAGLIMLAHGLAKSDAPNRRSLLFIAFTAEERGLLGSAHFLKKLDESGISADHMVAMVNMDMIGRVENDTLYVLGVGSGDRWKDMVIDAAYDHGLKPAVDSSPLGASDHASFFLKKVPAVHFFSGVHADYHKPSDTADKINAEGGARIVACINQVVRALSTEQQRLVFNSEGAKVARMSRGAGHGAFLGIMPDYATMQGDQGCGITGITPASPAADAGLTPGDLIVRWNNQKIGNVYDLTRVLGESKPDQSISLKVKREDQLLDITVKLGSR